MASSSSSQPATQDNTPLPLILCHTCGNTVLTKDAFKGTRPGVRYYKCPLFSSGLCVFFGWREGYAGLLGANGGLTAAAGWASCSGHQQPGSRSTESFRVPDKHSRDADCVGADPRPDQMSSYK
ncbi:uncharacterized protein LOC124678786 [Lolium rigidum]|uniref:uncharacterized protein LOC124678786 n=1 Tax=Lolium rigidum TaxID=89674 RepID=UPI001F5CD490|nr:uncharacterized protein LOC124678786 [Lolium rigidum]